MIHLLEVDAFDPSVGGVVTLRFSSGEGYTSLPGDTPGNEWYSPHILQPGRYDRYLFGSGATTGASRVSYGDIELVNEDGSLDMMRKLAFDGRALRLFSLPGEGVSLSQRTAIFTGTLEYVEVTEGLVTLRIRDRLAELNKSLPRKLYLGTTTAGGQATAEGTENALKDLPKPLAWGVVREVPLVVANAFDGLYQGAENAVFSCDAVYEAGLAYTRVGATQTTIAGLMSLTVDVGQYAVMLSPFIVRVGGKPSGVITADFTEGATPADRSAAGIVRRILLHAGMVEGVDFLASDVTVFAAQAPAVQGVWVPAQDATALALISRVFEGVGGSLSPDRLGVFRMEQFTAPAGEPVKIFGETEILDDGQAIETLATNDPGSGIPALKTSLTWGWIWQVQDETSIAGTVRENNKDRVAFLKQESRTATTPEDAGVKLAHLLAPTLELNSLIVARVDAEAEAARRQALYGVRRDFLRLRVASREAVGLDLGDVVRIELPRFDLDDGKDFRVIGFSEDFDAEETTLELFG